MKFSRRTLATALLAALLPVAGRAVEDVARAHLLDPDTVIAAAREVTADRYPNADTVLVDDLIYTRYEPDGTFDVCDDEYLKILTEKGRRDAGMRAMHFTIPYDTVTVVRAEIIRPDGSRLPFDVERASRISIDTSQMAMNIYSPDSKLLQLSLPGIAIGDVLHFTTLRRGLKARVPNQWADLSLFEYDGPLVKLTFEVSSPNALPLRHIVLRDAVSNTVQTAQTPEGRDRTLYRWVARDVPQMYPEPNMPPLHTVVQRLLLSTAQDWPAISRWYWNLCQPRLADVSPEMRATVTALVAGVESRDERIRRIFTWVSQNISYKGITTEIVAPGYEPRDIGATFARRYGVCRDKAALLVGMLREAGVEAYPVLIHQGAKLDPEVPLPYFNHAIVAAARPEGGYDLMDPTDENTRDLFPSYLCNRSYLVAHPKGEPLRVSPIVPAGENLVQIRSHGRLDASGQLDLETEIRFDGINDNSYRSYLLRQKSEERRKFFEGLVKARLPGAELVAFDLQPANLMNTDEPLRARFACRVKQQPLRGDGLDVLDLPWFANSVGHATFAFGDTGLRQRRYTLETGVACGADETLTLDLGTALGAPVQLPGTIVTSRVGIAYARAVGVTNGTLTASLRLRLDRPEYPAADYPGLKAMLRDMEYASRQRALFAARDAAATDARLLDDDVQVSVTSPHDWSVTHTSVRQVLSYAGTKKYADVRLAYNPAWQSVEVLTGTVSNLDGSVQTVQPRELNAMDAEWSGAAPRYPAAKTLVISLPGVTTGSVITLCTRTTQRNAPFFSLRQAFRGFDACDRGRLTLTVPATLPLRLRQPGDDIAYACVTNADRSVSHRWIAPPQTALAQEERLPPLWSLAPVLFASAGDWPTYAGELHDDFEAAVRGGRQAAVTARGLVAGIDDPAARARAIRDYVARRVRLAGPTFDELPRGFSPADTTLADGYGHAADRAVVLAAMLRAVGLQAELLPAAAGRRDNALADPLVDLPQRDLLDTLLVNVRPARSVLQQLFGGGTRSLVGDDLPLVLDDGDQYAEPGTTARYGDLAIAPDGTRAEVTVPARFRPHTASDWSLVVAADGLAHITVTNWFAGADCGDFRRQYTEMPPEERRRHHQELVATLSQAAEADGPLLTDLSAYPALQSYAVNAERFAVRDGNRLTLLVPGGASRLIPLRADQRRLPLYVDDLTEADWECRMLLPAQVSALRVQPEEIDWELPAGFGTVRCTTRSARQPDGRLLVTLRRELRLRDCVLPPELYPSLLEMNRRLSHPAMRTIVADLATP